MKELGIILYKSVYTRRVMVAISARSKQIRGHQKISGISLGNANGVWLMSVHLIMLGVSWPWGLGVFSQGFPR